MSPKSKACPERSRRVQSPKSESLKVESPESQSACLLRWPREGHRWGAIRNPPAPSVGPGKATGGGQSAIANGFTLLEVLVAMAVLAVAMVSLLGLYNRSLVLTIRAQRLSTATLLAQEMLARTQLEGVKATRLTSGDFAPFHPGQYPEFRWQRSVRTMPIEGLWELRVKVSWGMHEDEACELTLFTSLEDQ